MTVLEEIYSLSVRLSETEDERLLPICAAVYENLLARLKSGVTADDCREAFVLSGALYSLSMLKNLDSLDLSSFDAGSLKVSFRGKSGDGFEQMAQQLIAPWCGDDFAFCGVSG